MFLYRSERFSIAFLSFFTAAYQLHRNDAFIKTVPTRSFFTKMTREIHDENATIPSTYSNPRNVFKALEHVLAYHFHAHTSYSPTNMLTDGPPPMFDKHTVPLIYTFHM